MEGCSMAKRNRYKEMEKLMTTVLIADAIIFLLYLIVAGAGIVWLKVLTAILCFVFSLAGLGFLYLTKELLRQRSLWLSTGFFAVFMCVLVSLIVAFP